MVTTHMEPSLTQLVTSIQETLSRALNPFRVACLAYAESQVKPHLCNYCAGFAEVVHPDVDKYKYCAKHVPAVIGDPLYVKYEQPAWVRLYRSER